MFHASAFSGIDGGDVVLDANLMCHGRVGDYEEFVRASERGVERGGFGEVAMAYFDSGGEDLGGGTGWVVQRNDNIAG